MLFLSHSHGIIFAELKPGGELMNKMYTIMDVGAKAYTDQLLEKKHPQ